MLHHASVPPSLASRPARRRPLIGLTSLIDVVFILLIFFMLASSFLDWRTIELNTPVRGAAAPALDGAMLVEVRRDDLRLSGETVSLDILADRVAKRLGRVPDQRVVVKPGDGVPLQDMIGVLDRLVAAGAHDLSLSRDGAR